MTPRTLGGTGLPVSPLALGTMMFGPTGNADRGECVRIVHEALDAGVTLVDTADLYSRGESERIVGEALAGGRRDRVVLTTKFTGPMSDDPLERGASRRWVHRAVDASLRRLGTDWIDVYHIHRPDPATDLDETLGALTDLVRAGKIRYIGTSTFEPAEIVESLWIADRRQRERVRVEQPPYSLLSRGIETELLPVCVRHGIGVVTWSPLGGGWLSGRHAAGAETIDSRRAARFPERWDLSLPANAEKLRAVVELDALARDNGMSLVELALAFVLEHPAVSSVLVGPRTIEHLRSQLPAAHRRLDPDVLDAIDAIVPPGVTLNPEDDGVERRGLAAAARRRPAPVSR